MLLDMIMLLNGIAAIGDQINTVHGKGTLERIEVVGSYERLTVNVNGQQKQFTRNHVAALPQVGLPWFYAA